eukprot:snap_masked-scaffold_9-processed-gene-13.81-mRNA-1 protein AED:1.00 eAED:1.00 QI:0/-1/0/0/-1/1/1/0/400
MEKINSIIECLEKYEINPPRASRKFSRRRAPVSPRSASPEAVEMYRSQAIEQKRKKTSKKVNIISSELEKHRLQTDNKLLASRLESIHKRKSKYKNKKRKLKRKLQVYNGLATKLEQHRVKVENKLLAIRLKEIHNRKKIILPLKVYKNTEKTRVVQNENKEDIEKMDIYLKSKANKSKRRLTLHQKMHSQMHIDENIRMLQRLKNVQSSIKFKSPLVSKHQRAKRYSVCSPKIEGNSNSFRRRNLLERPFSSHVRKLKNELDQEISVISESCRDILKPRFPKLEERRCFTAREKEQIVDDFIELRKLPVEKYGKKGKRKQSVYSVSSAVGLGVKGILWKQNKEAQKEEEEKTGFRFTDEEHIFRSFKPYANIKAKTKSEIEEEKNYLSRKLQEMKLLED